MTEGSAVVISIETDTADDLRKAVQSGLYAYNDQFAGPMDYSALMIYEKQGYSVYAVQEDYPAGHRKFMLRKTFPKVEWLQR
jgi:hypothetical protein